MESEGELWQRIIMCWCTAESKAFFSFRLMCTPAPCDIESCRCMHQWAVPLGKHKSEHGIASSANAQLYWFAISVHLTGFLFFIFPKQILECWLDGDWFCFRCSVLEWRMRWNDIYVNYTIFRIKQVQVGLYWQIITSTVLCSNKLHRKIPKSKLALTAYVESAQSFLRWSFYRFKKCL